MSDSNPVPTALQRVLVDLPASTAAIEPRQFEFPAADGAPLPWDLYLPASAPSEGGLLPPVVQLVEGYADAGFVRVVGCPFRAMGPVVSWARLLAAAGLAAVAGSNRAPAADAAALFHHLRRAGAELGFDGERRGLLAASGNAPVALSLLMDAGDAVRCAAFLYPLLLDLDGAGEVAAAAMAFRFDNACAGRSLAELPAGVPLFVARAGRDESPGLNASLDRFATRALALGLPLTVVDHTDGPHAFDLVHDSPRTREIVAEVVAFLRQNLRAGPSRASA